LRGCYGYWPISADKAKQRLESQAATYWGTRPPRRVNEEEDKTAPKKRIRQPVEGWHHSMAVLLGPELTKNKNLELKGFPNVVDAVAALNSGETPTPKAIAKAGYCVTYSNRTKVYYVLYLEGKREKAMQAFGVDRPAKKIKT